MYAQNEQPNPFGLTRRACQDFLKKNFYYFFLFSNLRLKIVINSDEMDG